MTSSLAVLAVLMWAVTYPWRAVPMLAAGMDRLPGWALDYLRLVGPAVLAALAAVNVLVVGTADGSRQLHVGIETVAVLACVALVIWRRTLLPGLLTAVLLVALVRATGF